MIHSNAYIADSIIGWRCSVGKWVCFFIYSLFFFFFFFFNKKNFEHLFSFLMQFLYHNKSFKNYRLGSKIALFLEKMFKFWMSCGLMERKFSLTRHFLLLLLLQLLLCKFVGTGVNGGKKKKKKGKISCGGLWTKNQRDKNLIQLFFSFLLLRVSYNNFILQWKYRLIAQRSTNIIHKLRDNRISFFSFFFVENNNNIHSIFDFLENNKKNC